MNRPTYLAALARTGIGAGLLAGWVWFAPHIACWGHWATLLLLTTLIAISGIEQALYRRRAFVGMYLRPTSRLYRLLRGGYLLVALALLKALIIALILLSQALFWPGWIWLLLALDLWLYVALYQGAVRLIGQAVRPGYVGMFARVLLDRVHTLILALIVCTGLFLTPHFDYRASTILRAMEHAVAMAPRLCPILDPWVALIAAWHGAGWWLAQQALVLDSARFLVIVAWLLFLLASAAFTWAWTRLLAGCLVALAPLYRELATPIWDRNDDQPRQIAAK